MNFSLLTTGHCPEGRNPEIRENNGEERQRRAHWNGEEGLHDSCKIISRRNEDKLELSSFNYTFTSDLSLRKN